MSIINPIFINLPKELIHLILEYSDAIVYRHGKYMNRILKNDKRYTIVQYIIDKPFHYTTNKFYIWFPFPKNVDKDKEQLYDGFVYKYHFIDKMMHIIKQYYHCIQDTSSSLNPKYIYSNKNITQYLIDANGLWRITVSYSM